MVTVTGKGPYPRYSGWKTTHLFRVYDKPVCKDPSKNKPISIRISPHRFGTLLQFWEVGYTFDGLTKLAAFLWRCGQFKESYCNHDKWQDDHFGCITFQYYHLGGGNSNIFYVHPEPWGRWTHFDEHIFQMGWFNHQADFNSTTLCIIGCFQK